MGALNSSVFGLRHRAGAPGEAVPYAVGWTAGDKPGYAPARDVPSLPVAIQCHSDLGQPFEPEGELLRQARFALDMGSPFVAAILQAGHRHLARAPRTAASIRNWVGDPAQAAMAMRFNAALHAAARKGRPAALQALYQGLHDDFDGAVAQALAENDDAIAEALCHPTQTNEVGRAGALMAALMVLANQHGLSFELNELGASCGLNLNLAHYRYDLGGMAAGQASSPILIAPIWHGAPPAVAPVAIASAHGADLNPLDPNDPAVVERLISYIWADDYARLYRLTQALHLARQHLPQVEHANALPWLEHRLRLPPRPGVCRVVLHSMMAQYFSAEDRAAVKTMIRAAGARASADAPLAWISFEWTETRGEVRLLLTSWPGGETRHLATCHPYGSWIVWHG